jgi:hypothetical protein
MRAAEYRAVADQMQNPARKSWNAALKNGPSDDGDVSPLVVQRDVILSLL